MMTLTVPKSRASKQRWKNTSFLYKKKKFQRKWPNKQRYN